MAERVPQDIKVLSSNPAKEIALQSLKQIACKLMAEDHKDISYKYL